MVNKVTELQELITRFKARQEQLGVQPQDFKTAHTLLRRIKEADQLTPNPDQRTILADLTLDMADIIYRHAKEFEPLAGLDHPYQANHKKVQNKGIYISYDHNLEPDCSIARKISQALAQKYELFTTPTTAIETQGTEQLQHQLLQTNFFIALLSTRSVDNEMIRQEIEMAHRLLQSQNEKPVILPVRLAYRNPFPNRLGPYLDPLNWSYWRHAADTPRIIKELDTAISGGHLPVNEELKPYLLKSHQPSSVRSQQIAPSQPALATPGGTMPLDSPFYIERSSDQVALRAIERQGGATITIEGSRQIGKSSLLIRTAAAAQKMGKRVVHFDFQQFDENAWKNRTAFFQQLCFGLTQNLGLENEIEQYWQGGPSSDNTRCTRYMHDHILKGLAGGMLVLAMDEVDRIFDTDFRSSFFGMLRSWHNDRGRDPIYRQLDLILVTSTEPYQFIKNFNQSPFNVGEHIELEDFNLDQVAELNQRHGSPIEPSDEAHLTRLLRGHPYLVHRAIYLVADKRFTTSEIFNQAAKDGGAFNDHLSRHLARLQADPKQLKGMRQVIREHACSDDEVFIRLQAAGLVRRVGRGLVLPRCQLYADYFGERLDG